MKVCIIGGGASGMAAAITAAQNGHEVTLLERQARVGRKLLSTGNGRCNLTNLRAGDPARYHGDGAFISAVLERTGPHPGAALDWFASLGLLTAAEEEGRVYPYSNVAGSVLDVLRFALERLGAEVRTGCVVTALRPAGCGFTVEGEGFSLSADAVILAAGGAAGAKVGGVMDGYRLAAALGHRRTALYPSLVQLKTDPTYPRALKGVKAHAAVSVCREGTVLDRSEGEILFTEYGVSGPAVFDVSRAAATEPGPLVCRLDFLPGQTPDETARELRRRRELLAGREAQALLVGLLHQRLGQTVCKAAGFTAQSAETLTERDLRAIAEKLRNFTLPVTGVCGFDQAQVTAGGLRTEDFDPRTLESRLVPGFYACGEVLDADGDCGGFNLHWAWCTGRLAGALGGAKN